jgi:hypothetical protein
MKRTIALFVTHEVVLGIHFTSSTVSYEKDGDNHIAEWHV